MNPTQPGTPYPEKSKSADQKAEARCQRIEGYILANRGLSPFFPGSRIPI
jgi:hypothetical protein